MTPAKTTADTPLELLQPTQPLWRDYLELTKPKVVALLLLTAAVGMHLATNQAVPLAIFFWASLGIGLTMAGSAAINHAVDQRIDLLMSRTHQRPVATGRISVSQAIIFALLLCITGLGILYFKINLLTTVLTLLGGVGYAIIYTLYLKRATPQNIVIGGLAGAIPPLLGWTAITNNIHPHALLLVLIIFVWTPPHFWALAIYRHEEYARAKIPMLPVTHGIAFTKTQTLLYTILLVIASLLPYLTQMSGWLYLIGVVALDIGFLYYAIRLKWGVNEKIAIQTFAYSIVYLFALFIILLLDHYFIAQPVSL